MPRLLDALRESPTDLGRLVHRAVMRPRAAFVVPAPTLAAWERRDPAAWTTVRGWLLSRGVNLIYPPGAP